MYMEGGAYDFRIVFRTNASATFLKSCTTFASKYYLWMAKLLMILKGQSESSIKSIFLCFSKKKYYICIKTEENTPLILKC